MKKKEIVWQGVEWNHVVQDMHRWQAVINTVMRFPGSVKGGNFLSSSAAVKLLKKDSGHVVS
jgi:hypothetical protein